MERNYSAKEIDELRAVVEERYLYGTSAWDGKNGRSSCSYSEKEMAVIVEERVRTYMMAGRFAEELRHDDLVKEQSRRQGSGEVIHG